MNNSNYSMSEKLRNMVVRSRAAESRSTYSMADVIRWLGTTEKNLKNLVYCLNCRESLGITFKGKALFFEVGI